VVAGFARAAATQWRDAWCGILKVHSTTVFFKAFAACAVKLEQLCFFFFSFAIVLQLGEGAED
jgi:hypothetical protein